MPRRLLTSRSLLPVMQSQALRSGTKRSSLTGSDVNIELTDAGQAFLKEARAVLATVEAAELALIEFSNLKRGVLSVQASQTIANYWLPRHLAAFRSAYPQIEIRASIGNTAQVATAVENRETELGFVEAAIHSEQLTSTDGSAGSDHRCCGPGSRIAQAQANHAHVTSWKSNGCCASADQAPGQSLKTALVKFGLKARALRIALELPSNEAVRSAAEAGLGAAVISASIAAPSLEAGLLQQIAFRLPEREFYVLTHRDRHPSRAARAFLEMLTDSRTAKRSRRPNV